MGTKHRPADPKHFGQWAKNQASSKTLVVEIRVGSRSCGSR